MTDTTVESGPNLHGEAPDAAPVVLLLIDVINDFDFPESSQLLRHAVPMAKRIADLKTRVGKNGVPVIYVNDNFGRWRSDFRTTVEHCRQPGSAGREIAALLNPEPEDYFVLKPRHSGFFSTTLDILLRDLRTESLILTGVAGDICVLFTANDAYMRGFRLFVPEDCVASNTAKKNRGALVQMQTALKADIRPSTDLPWDAITRPLSSNPAGPRVRPPAPGDRVPQAESSGL